MIRHTKHRCEININPSRRVINQYTPTLSLNEKVHKLCEKTNTRQITESGYETEEMELEAIDVTMESPERVKSKLSRSYVETTGDSRGLTKSPDGAFRCRVEWFQSPPHPQRQKPTFSHSPGPSMRNRLNKDEIQENTMVNSAVSQFCTDDLDSSQQQEWLRLKRQNQQLKRILSIQDPPCPCQAPHTYEQTLYLRTHLHSHLFYHHSPL